MRWSKHIIVNPEKERVFRTHSPCDASSRFSLHFFFWRMSSKDVSFLQGEIEWECAMTRFFCVWCSICVSTHYIFGLLRMWLCCSVLLQCVAVCCSVLQCVAVCCSALQCVARRQNTFSCENNNISASLKLITCLLRTWHVVRTPSHAKKKC